MSSTTVIEEVVTDKEKKKQRYEKFNELRKKKNEASRINKKELVEEDRRKKLPENWETKQRRMQYELREADLEKEAKEKGHNYKRLKYMNMMALEGDVEYRKRKKKEKGSDHGFSDHRQAAMRSHKKNTDSLPIDLEAYAKHKADCNGTDIDIMGTRLTEEAIDRVVSDIKRQEEKRKSFSRRRTFDEEADIDYINERNRRFNQKLERIYGQHTAELKQNLERGTAL